MHERLSGGSKTGNNLIQLFIQLLGWIRKF